MDTGLVYHSSIMLLEYCYTMQFGSIKLNASAYCTSAFGRFILTLGPQSYNEEGWSKYLDGSCGELNASVPGVRLRDIALIGELLILQGIWVPDVSINAPCRILLRKHKNDIGGTAGDP